MSTKRNGGLGRNLSALLSQSGGMLLDEAPPASVLKLAVDCMQPGQYQPRRAMDEESLQELAESIKRQGLLQPILVRELPNGCYEIIAGERRWRASQIAGLDEVPVILKQVDDETAMAMALVENLQREDLNAMDQARAMFRLTNEFALTHQQVAELLSKSRASVSNFLRLLSLSETVKHLLEAGQLDMGHARALLALEEAQQKQAAQIIVAKNLSVREAEKLVARMQAEAAPARPHSTRLSLYQAQLEALASDLKTKIQLQVGKEGKGALVIHYTGEDVLQTIIERLKTEQK